MPIKTLAPEVVGKIAAGEVIERPASVVKELVENSLDAGATEISVEAHGAGIELLKVTDNGAGIPVSEAELAFHRYATSKISDLADLDNILSLGFRGEALPSIAAVAEVELSTKTSSDIAGSYLHLRNGEIIHSESCARARGTTVIVRRLFRYFPARLKFLKSASTENSHTAHLLTQYALAFPEVKFSLIIDRHPSLRTVGNGDLREVLSQIYGLEVAEGMLEVRAEDTFGEVTGLVSQPRLTRSNRNYLSFFVNRRWIYSPLLVKATEQAYHGLLMVGEHPIAVIKVLLPPDEVDVNVHPKKAQVKFRHEQLVFTTIEKAIKEALAKAPVAKFETVPFVASLGQKYSPEQPLILQEGKGSFITPLPILGLPVLRILGQLANSYIVAEGPEGLYLIDQHAAHERIRYEKILAQWSERKVEVQGLLQLQTIELSPREEEILNANRESLAQFGFNIEPFGDRSYLIRAVPSLITGTNLIQAVNTLLNNLASRDDQSPWQEKIAKSLACHGAIKAGQQLSNEEMRELIKRLEQAKQPRSCPHGRPTMILLSLQQLEKEFGRIN